VIKLELLSRMRGSVDKLWWQGNLFFWAMAFVFALLLGVPDFLNGYWRFDDGGHLMWALEHKLFDYFLDPEVTRKVSMGQLTPWNTFFYDLNVNLFGLDPRPMYLHLHLVSGVVSVLFYQLMRELRCDRYIALLIAMAFIVSAPWQSVSHGLMTGHYVYGMAFCQLGLLLAVRAVRSKGGASLWPTIMIILSGLTYAGALSCKELYVLSPLVLSGFILLAYFDNENCCREFMLKRSLLIAISWGFILVGYIGWRHAITGSLQGGYFSSASLASIGSLSLTERAVTMCYMVIALPASGVNWLMMVYLLLIVSIVFLMTKMNKPERLASFFFITATLPVVMFLSFLAASLLQLITPPPRYAVMLTWSLLLVVALSVRRVRFHQIPRGMFLLPLGLFLLANIAFLPTHLWPTLKESESYYRFATGVTETSGILLLPEITTARYDDQLWAIRQSYGRYGVDLPEAKWTTMPHTDCSEMNDFAGSYWLWSGAKKKLLRCEEVD